MTNFSLNKVVAAGAFAAMVLAGAGMLIFYHEIFQHPASYMFEIHGDGLANYFTFAWHICVDDAIATFNGMNYPYGEFLPYVDCHPALSSVLQLLTPSGAVAAWPVGLLNILMLLSPVACALFLYLILMRFNVDNEAGNVARYKVPVWGAVLAAPAIALLSSQALLMQFGHYALSYSVFFPMGWYLLMRFDAQPGSLKWTVAVILNILLWTFTHNYLGAILILFTAVVHLQHLLARAAWQPEQIGESFMRIAQVAVPVALIFLVAIGLDPHDGRIHMPFDPAHTASLYTVFMPNYSMTRPLFDMIFDLAPQTQQSWGRVGNYIGIPSILAVLALIIFGVRKLLPAHRKHAMPQVMTTFLPYLVSGLVLLAFSMGLHFRITGQALLELVPPIKQFVGLGRFAWGFYYVICVGTIVLIASVRSGLVRNILLMLAVVVYTLESVGYHKQLSSQITQSPNVLDAAYSANKELLELTEGYDLDLYQAIIPLPFYHKYVTPGIFGHADSSILYSMRFAYLTEKPLVSAVLSRPSVEEGRSIMQLFAPNQYDKPIRNAIPDERPFLVLYTGDALHPMEQQMYDESEPMRHNGKLELRAIAHRSLFEYDHATVGFTFLEQYESMIQHPSGWRSEDSVGHIEYVDFNKTPATQTYRGSGAWSGDIAQEQVIFTSTYLKAGSEYVLSFWYYNHLYDQLYNTMWIEELDGLGKTTAREAFSPTANPLSDGDWVWNEVRWTIRQNGGRIVLRSSGEARYASTFYVDEILLRETGPDVYRVIPAQLEAICVKNNQTVARVQR